MVKWGKLFLLVLLLVSLALSVACSPSVAKPVDTAKSAASNGNSVGTPSQSSASVADNTTVGQPSSAANTTKAVDVVVAGYINHGPLQPTVQAIKDVLAKYGDKVKVTWVDSSTQQGQDYFKEHGLTAHMNVIINGTSKYQVNGKSIEFTWFEGQGWTRQDLDTVLSGLVKK
ncbi:MAG: hypothetical protein ACYDHZ_09590 [Dehalococcoidia bacterium]